MDAWHSYPSVYALGHKALTELLLDPVLVEEKIDGSLCGFGLYPEHQIADGYRVRSKGAELNLDAPEKMFIKAVQVIRGLPLHEGWMYCAEYLGKAKHNALAYDRTPNNYLIIFDIKTGNESYLSYDEKAEEATRLGLEVVPRIREGMVTDLTQFRAWLDTVSCLGGQKVEGLVCKNYSRFGPDKKVLMGKFVSEAFKEVHAVEWKQANPTQGDVVQLLIGKYRTPTRWAKAVQHLTESGQLEGSPRDIGLLIKEVPGDVLKECETEVRDALFEWAWPKIRRGLATGLAEWYKALLLAKQFEKTEE